MKHFKLFLLPLLAITLVFSSCEQQDLSLTYIEPIQDWGKSPQDILEKMTKSKSGAILDYSENYEDLYFMEYKNYGISDYVGYSFSNNKLYYSVCTFENDTYKQTIKDYLAKKYTLVEYEKFEYYEDRYCEEFLYNNKKKTSSILLRVEHGGDINVFYAPYNEGGIDDFYDTLDSFEE